MRKIYLVFIVIFFFLINCEPEKKELKINLFKNKGVISILVGGDVQFDFEFNTPRVQISDYKRTFLQKMYDKICNNKGYFQGSHFPQYFLKGVEPKYKQERIRFEKKIIWKEWEDYPFYKIKSLVKNADLAFINLETPIADSDKSRIVGNFRSDPIFAESLFEAGIDVVSIANNHAWDCGENGFLETMNNLQKADVKYVGGGKNINEARKPVVFDINGMKIAFLAYSQEFKYPYYTTCIADKNNSGIAPFSLFLIKQDVEHAKLESDLVFVSLHWGVENTDKIHPKAIEYAHEIINYGADAIIGHHSHVPKGIEIYCGKPIFYSLGNFIFGMYSENWQNNFLAKIFVKGKRITGVEIIPITGKGQKLHRPELLTGKEAYEFFSHIKKLSSKLKTEIIINKNKAFISIP